jgi:hypothetical protein
MSVSRACSKGRCVTQQWCVLEVILLDNCFFLVFNHLFYYVYYVYVYRYMFRIVLLCVIFVSLVVVLLGSSIRLRFDTLFHPRARTGLDSLLFFYSSDGAGLVAIPI